MRTMTEAPRTRLSGVACGYGRRVVLREVDLDLPSRGLLALIGPNGSGKTTLLRTLLGLLAPLAGRLEHPRSGQPPRVGYVPQTDVSELRFPLSALDVALQGLLPGAPAWRAPSVADRARARAALQRFDVAALAGQPFRSLSGGQRQRVLLARALVGEPELLVLDEPVRGLDFASAATLVALLSQLAAERGLSVIAATHSLDLVANHADHVALVKDGRVRSGPAAQLLSDESLSAFHGRPVIVREVDGRRVVLPGRAPADGAPP